MIEPVSGSPFRATAREIGPTVPPVAGTAPAYSLTCPFAAATGSPARIDTGYIHKAVMPCYPSGLD